MKSGFFRAFFKQADKLFSAGLALAGALALAQFPQFIAQYLQRLGGHIDEARMVAKTFRLEDLTARAGMLSSGWQAIADSGPMLKPWYFLTQAQWGIARETWRHFTPGLTFNREELYCLIGGALLGMLLYEGVKAVGRLIRKLYGMIAAKPEQNSGPPASAPTTQ